VCPRCRSIYATKVQWCGIDNTPLVEQPNDPLIGSELERYLILERLGVGGMGCVYRAKHTFIDRAYAIKVLFGDFAGDPKFQERFRREAKSVSQIRHPNIVTVEDFGTTTLGLTFLAMEMVTGRTLEKAIEQEAPFSPLRTAQIIRQVVSGLGAAHELGFVHRDVKPSNVMLSDKGGMELVKILDFGAVSFRSAPGDQRLTSVGHIIGTPTYMAPEQSQDPAVGPPADLYAVGVMTYEMLTGKPPFVGKGRAEVLIKHIMEVPPVAPPSRGLERIVAALLEKQVTQRPQTAREVLEMIDGLGLDIDVPVEAPRVPQAALPTTEIPGRRMLPATRKNTPSTDPRSSHEDPDPGSHPTPRSGPKDVLGYDTFPALDGTAEPSQWVDWDPSASFAEIDGDPGSADRKRALADTDEGAFGRQTAPTSPTGLESDDVGHATDPTFRAPPISDDLSPPSIGSSLDQARTTRAPIPMNKDPRPAVGKVPRPQSAEPRAPDPLFEPQAPATTRAIARDDGPTQIDFRLMSEGPKPAPRAPSAESASTLDIDTKDPLDTRDPDSLIPPPVPAWGADPTPHLDQIQTISDRDTRASPVAPVVPPAPTPHAPTISDPTTINMIADLAIGATPQPPPTVELPAMRRGMALPPAEDFLDQSDESMSLKARVIPLDELTAGLDPNPPQRPRSSRSLLPLAIAGIILFAALLTAAIVWGNQRFRRVSAPPAVEQGAASSAKASVGR
jgi:serine/threonine-protein kinase